MAKELTANILINCPVCNKRGKISVEENIIIKSARGVTAINVAPDLVCGHSFVAYIDRNLAVRDSFVCDFKVELPEISIQKTKPSETTVDFDLDVIKINLYPTLLINTLRGVLHGKKVAILYQQEFVKIQFMKFFEYIMEGTYKPEIVVISNKDFKNDKKDYKNYLVFEGSKIIQDKEKFNLNKKLKLENVIVQKFYSEFDPQSCLIIFKNEIQKSYRLAEQLIELNENLKEGEEFTTKLVFEYLLEHYHVKVPFNYILFLIDIIDNYFNVNLKKPSDSADLLYFL